MKGLDRLEDAEAFLIAWPSGMSPGLTKVSDNALKGAVEMVKQRVRILEGELCRRDLIGEHIVRIRKASPL